MSTAAAPVNAVATTSAAPAPVRTLLYRTFSICPVCAFTLRKGLQWQNADVFEENGNVYIVVLCETHKAVETFYCSNADFFKKCMAFTPGILEPQVKGVMDIEELERRLSFKNPDVQNKPLIMDVAIFKKGLKEFESNEVIKAAYEKVAALYPPKRNFVLRVSGKLADNMQQLNDKINYILTFCTENPILLELSFDRLMALSRLTDSVLLNPLIHPSVRIYVRVGEEEQNTNELRDVLYSLKLITNLQVVVTVCISRPFPRIGPIIELLRANAGLVRFVVLHLERTPNQIKDNFSTTRPGLVDRTTRDERYSVDPYELLQLIQSETNSQISVHDFFPASVSMVLEPFLQLLNQGSYTIRPSPHCGFGTCLINTGGDANNASGDGGYRSVPLSRLIDMGKFFNHMIPLVDKLNKATIPKLGFFDMRKLKKAISESALPNVQLPDLLSYATDPAKAEVTKAFIRNLQFFVIHNNMDVAVIDGIRRARCMVCSPSTISKSGVVADCTHCI